MKNSYTLTPRMSTVVQGGPKK